MSAFPTGIVYLGELAAAGSVSDTDTTFWCDVAAGGTVGVSLKRVSASQLSAYFTGKIAGFSAVPPLQLSGGGLSLLYDSTLAVIGGHLSVVGGGSGGTPANPTATVSGTPVNGVATTYMRSDAAPALAPIPGVQGSWSNATITVDGQGRITAASSGTPPAGSTGANPSAQVGATPVFGSANTYLRSDGAPPLQPFGTAGTYAYPTQIVTDTTGRVSSVTGGSAPAAPPVGAPPTGTINGPAVPGSALTWMRSDAAPALQVITGLTPGSYNNTNLTVDQYGRVTVANTGTSGGAGPDTVDAGLTAGAPGSPLALRYVFNEVTVCTPTNNTVLLPAFMTTPGNRCYVASYGASPVMVLPAATQTIWSSGVSNGVGVAIQVNVGFVAVFECVTAAKVYTIP